MAHATANKKDFEQKDNKGGVGQMASNLKDKAQEAASTAVDKAREIGSSAVDKAREIGSTVMDRADSAAATVGDNMKSLADKIKQNAPHEGMLGSASSAVAGTIENAGRYLQEQGLSGAGEDLTRMIRNHPIPAILLGIGLGFLLARVTRS